MWTVDCGPCAALCRRCSLPSPLAQAELQQAYVQHYPAWAREIITDQRVLLDRVLSARLCEQGAGPLPLDSAERLVYDFAIFFEEFHSISLAEMKSLPQQLPGLFYGGEAAARSPYTLDPENRLAIAASGALAFWTVEEKRHTKFIEYLQGLFEWELPEVQQEVQQQQEEQGGGGGGAAMEE